MARRKFGAPYEVHTDRANSERGEIKRLIGVTLGRMKKPADCEGASRLIRALAFQTGALTVDGHDGGVSTAIGKRLLNRLYIKFDKACLVKPRSAAAKRKIHAVWRRSS